jgi:tetratricopeptide (TPR) repeat protein
VAKTWNITLERLNPLGRALLRFAAWFGPDAMPRGIFSADPIILSEGLGESIEDLDLAIEEALGELARFSLIRLTPETVSVHRLLQAVEQDALTKEECARWLEWAVRLFNAFAPGSPDDARTWSIWLTLLPQAEALIKNTQSRGMNATTVGLLANQYAMFLYARANYTQAEPLYQRALTIREKALGLEHPEVAASLNNLAELYRTQGQYEKAEPLYQRALAIREKALGPDHPNVATQLNNLAQLLQATNRLSDAEPLNRRVLEIFLRFTAATRHEHPHLSTIITNYSVLLKECNIDYHLTRFGDHPLSILARAFQAHGFIGSEQGARYFVCGTAHIG